MISGLLAVLLVPLSSRTEDKKVKGLALGTKRNMKKVSMYFLLQPNAILNPYVKYKIKLIYDLTPHFLASEAISLVINPSAKKIYREESLLTNRRKGWNDVTDQFIDYKIYPMSTMLVLFVIVLIISMALQDAPMIGLVFKCEYWIVSLWFLLIKFKNVKQI